MSCFGESRGPSSPRIVLERILYVHTTPGVRYFSALPSTIHEDLLPAMSLPNEHWWRLLTLMKQPRGRPLS